MLTIRLAHRGQKWNRTIENSHPFIVNFPVLSGGKKGGKIEKDIQWDSADWRDPHWQLCGSYKGVG